MRSRRQRCLRDLRERFAKIEIQASPPIVPFRETAVHGVDMAPPRTKDAVRGTIHGTVQSGLVNYTLRARPLPADVTAFLSTNIEALKRVVQKERELSNADGSQVDEAAIDVSSAQGGTDAAQKLANLAPAEFWKQLDALFAKAGREWQGVSSRIWAFGPRRIGPNILVDNLQTGKSRSLQHRSLTDKHTSASGTPARSTSPAPGQAEVETHLDEPDGRNESVVNERAFDESIDAAFQLTTLRGPLCNEPVQGMAYFVEKLEVDEQAEGADAREHLVLNLTHSGLVGTTDSSFALSQSTRASPKSRAVSSRQRRRRSGKACSTGRRASCSPCTRVTFRRPQTF